MKETQTDYERKLHMNESNYIFVVPSQLFEKINTLSHSVHSAAGATMWGRNYGNTHGKRVGNL